MSQERHQIAPKKIKIRQIFMFYHLKPWKSWKLFFHSYECQGIQTKNPFDETLGLSFDL
jgi:hypothetical protein